MADEVIFECNVDEPTEFEVNGEKFIAFGNVQIKKDSNENNLSPIIGITA